MKETVKFIITDELEISPASTSTCINLRKKFNLKTLSYLREINASVGSDKAEKLLSACLTSITPLDEVFGGEVHTCSCSDQHGKRNCCEWWHEFKASYQPEKWEDIVCRSR